MAENEAEARFTKKHNDLQTQVNALKLQLQRAKNQNTTTTTTTTAGGVTTSATSVAMVIALGGR
jgi:hypothetical protein